MVEEGTPDVRIVSRSGAACALLLPLAVLAVCPARLAAQTIDTIVVVRHNVYDRKRDAPKVVAGVGNALHITTQAWVVRRALLVRPGDPYDSAKVVESERALRALICAKAKDPRWQGLPSREPRSRIPAGCGLSPANSARGRCARR